MPTKEDQQELKLYLGTLNDCENETKHLSSEIFKTMDVATMKRYVSALRNEKTKSEAREDIKRFIEKYSQDTKHSEKESERLIGLESNFRDIGI